MSKLMFLSLLMGLTLSACVTSGQNNPARKDRDSSIDRSVERLDYGDRMGRFIH